MSIEFDPWYRANRDEIAAALARAVHDTAAADDAVDEAFVRAFERWDRVAELRSPTGWVYTVALNAARRTFRRRATEARLLERSPAGPATPTSDQADHGLGDVVATLPDRQRTAVTLRYLDGLTEAEIASRMGVTRSTVSSTLRDAHRGLADRLRNISIPEGLPMKLKLARVRAGAADGCDVAYLDTEVTEHVAFGSAVRDQIRVRRDDLVAIDVQARPPEIVWRWWHGIVDSVEGDSAQVRRPTAEGTTLKDVAVPTELRTGIRPGMSVWFGNDDGTATAIAVAGNAGPARDLLPRVAAAYE